jgi:hypothetical protein
MTAKESMDQDEIVVPGLPEKMRLWRYTEVPDKIVRGLLWELANRIVRQKRTRPKVPHIAK